MCDHESVCARDGMCVRLDGVRMCIWDAVCKRLRARVTGHKPVCLCVSLGVSQSGSGYGDGVPVGVSIGWGEESARIPGALDGVGVLA